MKEVRRKEQKRKGKKRKEVMRERKKGRKQEMLSEVKYRINAGTKNIFGGISVEKREGRKGRRKETQYSEKI